MLDLSVLPAFVALILAFLAPPGPDMTYMLAVGLQGGRRAAVRAILGIGTGMAVYASAVALGLGAVTNRFPAALSVVKLGGAAYLLWLAFTTVRGARSEPEDGQDVPAERWYLRGFLVSLSNPKVILFFLAVLPRFLGRAHNATAQLAMLGAVNVSLEVLLYGAIGLTAGAFRTRFLRHPGARRNLSYFAALVYLVLALVIGGETVLGLLRR